MSKSTTSAAKSKAIIDGVEVTTDTLTGRGGLSLFVRYLRSIGIYPQLETFFGSMRKSRKGQPIGEIFKQLFCFFVDGTSRHLVYFDCLARDEGYGAATESEAMLSSHAVKRFFRSFWWPRIYLFRHLLQRLFLWRLRHQEPDVVVLGVDTMVMDNDEARVRHGVKPTYKKVKGFQPLQMTWQGFIVDAVFRRGDAHSNHGDTVEKMVRHIVAKIRKHYRAGAPIILRMDSGFFDQKLFEVFETLGIGYICGGKLYKPIKDYLGQSQADSDKWSRYEHRGQIWQYLEFGSKCANWRRFRRTIFCRPLYQDAQMLLEFARPDTVLITNLGMGGAVDLRLEAVGAEHWFSPEAMIAGYHGRGSDELVHRALKDFGFEQMPFKRFSANAAFYYTMLVAFFLHETFKQDVCSATVATVCYATTLRRKIIDIAAKIVRHGHRVVLKVTAAAMEQLDFLLLWKKSGSPPRYCWR